MIRYMDDVMINEQDSKRVALVDNDKCITYAKLNTIVDNTACRLQKMGISNGKRVVIFMEKSIEHILASLSVLRAGGVFIPLDSEIPQSRIMSIIQTCEPDLAIISTESENNFSWEKLSIASVKIDAILVQGDMDEKPVTRGRDENDSAYVIFTSGSTGTPKGVEIRHKSIASFLHNSCDALGYSSTTRTLCLAPLYFDTSIHEIYCTLNSKGTVYLYHDIKSISHVMRTIEKYSITDLTIVGTLLKLMTSFLSINKSIDLTCLKSIIFCGEACPVSTVRRIAELLPTCNMVQGYGPTETTVGCMFNTRTDFSKVSSYGLLSMGKPLNGVLMYIVNDEGNLAGIGEVGELLIGGIQKMKGYCGNVSLTEKMFDKYEWSNGEELYHSGDYLLRDSLGDYYFAGRRDSMVKIRGKLVYMAEVERCILTYPGIEDVYVLPFNDRHEIAHLACVLVPVEKLGQNIIECLRVHIREKLPEYMMPEKFLVKQKDELAKTSTGKVDKRSLGQLVVDYIEGEQS